MTDLSHYVSGERVPGKSGRFADVFNPATGAAEKRVPLASDRRGGRGGRGRQGGLAGLGQDPAAAAGAHPRQVQVPAAWRTPTRSPS